MKFLVIGLLSTLLLTQGCSEVLPQQGLKQTSLSAESKDNIQASTPAKLTPKEVKSTSAVPLAVNVQDKVKTASKLDPKQSSQNKQMHLVVVSDDLRFFQHETPNYKGNGRFEINPDFPAPGNYTVFSDYSGGNSKEVTAQKIKIPGNIPLPTEIEKFSNTKVLADTKVTLQVPQSGLKSGKQVELSFNLQDIKSNQPVQDRKPRLIIVRSSSPLTEADYIPVSGIKDLSNGQVSFTSSFPQTGTYKLWLQFNHNGKVNTADFWVNIV